jgi:flagellar protein FlbD
MNDSRPARIPDFIEMNQVLDASHDRSTELIHVTRLNCEGFIVNSDLIETIEVTPDTVLTLTTGKKLMVRESVDEIVGRVLDYRGRVGIRIAYPGMKACGPDQSDERQAA